MLEVLWRLLGKNQAQHKLFIRKAPTEVVVEGMPPLVLSKHLEWHNGFPIPNWPAIDSWLDAITDKSKKNTAYNACGCAWLLHFAKALGRDYYLAESAHAIVVSSEEPNIARVTLDFMEWALKRIVSMLNGLAKIPVNEKKVLLIFNNQDDYYQYVSYYYPESGEFAYSAGMQIDAGYSHLVTVNMGDLSQIEPTIVHEMTHACLSHLLLPRWLDEGLAVNVEQKLMGQRISLRTPREMQEKHMQFWGEAEIQEFWSGASFSRPGDSNELSYELARLLVEQLAKDRESFRQFALEAERCDSGASAASEFLGIRLGAWVASMLGKENAEAFEPRGTQEVISNHFPDFGYIN